MTDWGVLDGGVSAPAAPTATSGASEAPAAQGWGRPDGGVVRQRVATSAPGAPAPPPADVPPPEATASLLRAGEHLWAKVDRQGGAVLGSGQRLRLPDGVPDDFYGWRRVQIVEPAVLSASVLPIPWDELAAGVGDDPAGLYHPEPVPEADTPERVRPFPVAAGPDLERLFEERVVESVQEQRDRAAQAERAADARAELAERAADQRAELAERAAAAQRAAVEQTAQDRVRIAENRAAAAEYAAEERVRDAESRAGTAFRDAQQRVVEAQARVDQADATVQLRAERAERAARQRADHAETVAREHGEAVERWAADVQRTAQREVADAQARAAEANATVDQRSAEASWKAEQQIEAERRAVQDELSGQGQRIERLRRTVAVLAGATVLIFLVAVLLGWLAAGSAA